MSIKRMWVDGHPDVQKAAEKLKQIEAEEVVWVADPKEYRDTNKDHERRMSMAKKDLDELKERLEWEYANALGETRRVKE